MAITLRVLYPEETMKSFVCNDSTWIAGAVLAASALAMSPQESVPHQVDPASVALPSTATLKGRVAVLPPKPPRPIKDYGSQPAIRVGPADSVASLVWVGSGAPALDPSTAPVQRIEQSGYQFHPNLLIVQTGTPVVFPNEDAMYHSVFSYSPTKRFDLGRFRKGEEPDAVIFDRAGSVQIFCEVHEHMRANLLVVDTPWFVRTESDGTFQISGITPGKHTVTIWLSPKQQFEQSIEVTAGQHLEVDWSNMSQNPSP